MCQYYPGNRYDPPEVIECPAFLANLTAIMERDGNDDATQEQINEAAEQTHPEHNGEEFDTREEAEYA